MQQKMNKKKILAIMRDTLETNAASTLAQAKDINQEANALIDALVDLSKCAILKQIKKNDPYMIERLKYHLTDIENFHTVGEDFEELMDCVNRIRNGYPLPSLMKSATDCKSLVTGNELDWTTIGLQTFKEMTNAFKENSIYDFTKKKLDK